ncbi:hypothetical protein ANG3_1866, partial [Streptococcus intermedius SK54 = ATCC 27335]
EEEENSKPYFVLEPFETAQL